MLQPSYNFNKT